jgi:superfamily II DNA or RNA helicase
MVKMRQWQQSCLDAFVEHRTVKKKNIFLFEACPGAGKSFMAAELTRNMVMVEENEDPNNRIDLVIVIVPWTSIQGDESNGMIQTFDVNNLKTRNRLMIRGSRIVSQPVPTDLDAIITTYAEAMCAEAIDTCKLWKSKGLKLAIIFDEIHHANELDGAWGSYAEQLQALAEMTIVMSGTFFRTDGFPIKFVPYTADGYPELSCPAYKYASGVRDRVVRPVSCRFTNVDLRCIEDDKGVSDTSLFSVSPMDKNLGKMMAEVFHPEGDCVRKLILDVDEHLTRTRRRFPNAGALFTCRPGRGESSEDKHVHQIAQKIRQYTGKEVVVVTHVDKNSEGKIAAFRNSYTPYLVAVNMVSEGVDIPRLRAIGFMRYISSEMMFRQIVGRSVRMTDDEDGTASMIFMPKFQLMHQFALNMEGEALQGLRDMRCKECGQYPCMCNRTCEKCLRDPCICLCETCGQYPCECIVCKPENTFSVLAATPFGAGGSLSQDEVEEYWLVRAVQVIEKYPQHSHANPVQLAHAMSLAFQMKQEPEQEKPLQETYLTSLNNVRSRVVRLIQKLAAKAYGFNFQRCWTEEFMIPFKSDWDTAKNTWTVFELEQLANRLEERLLEAYKNGK